ncbi:hypothetical protein Bca101_027005 [Brassica carinata]
MGPKTSHKVALLLPILLLILTLSSQVRVIEATSRKLVDVAASGRTIVYTPSSRSCGATHATWKKKKRGPCRRPPRTAPASYQSP